MGSVTSVTAVTGPQPVLRAQSHVTTGDRAFSVALELPQLATEPVSASNTRNRVAPELPPENAVRMLLEIRPDVELDNIPFVGDDAVLLDDLPLTEPDTTEVPREPEQVKDLAQRGYLAGREATGGDVTATEDTAPAAVKTDEPPIPPP